ncbi:Chorismate mutase (EC [Pseudomonas [fluorescens] SBW25]|uniref:chorismate mutase n=2 Tax=Pseudomonas fluorescens TaxID=294 RepID=C3K500_PSEFS|nr:4-amino-4-deoxychorismate mutase [synthetic construct]KJZ52536.1 chorismate mutase [Pseudomonas marginalis]KJZ56386.1 chorismate mutase [Pseudomonas marginalis]CAI2796053.1 Chorismate mutase (EC [Pseudomonas fluorescens SBW25]
MNMTEHRHMSPTTPSAILQPQRDQLDRINNHLVDLLGERMSVCMDIAELKAAHDIPMMQPQRIVQVLDQLKDKSSTVGLRPDYVQSVFKLIIEETCIQEEQLIQRRRNQGQRS